MAMPLVTLAAVVVGLAACLAVAYAGLRAAARRQAMHLREEEYDEGIAILLPAATRR